MIISGPGKPLLELAGQSGAIAILCNGPSLPFDRLGEISIPTFGMNRTFKFPSRYYLALESEWLNVDYAGDYFLNATTFTIKKRPTNYDRGWRVPLTYDVDYSNTVEAGFFPASTGYLALQIVSALGYRPIHFLGLDLHGDHFDGSPSANGKDHHNKYFRIAARYLPSGSVFICASPNTRCDVFAHSQFESLTKKADAVNCDGLS